MFASHTRESIIALAVIDKGVTEAERKTLMSVLTGKRPISEVVSYKDAARMIGMSVCTVKKLAAQGILKRIVNGGKRACGVTEESLLEYAQGESAS